LKVAAVVMDVDREVVAARSESAGLWYLYVCNSGEKTFNDMVVMQSCCDKAMHSVHAFMERSTALSY
jgi:hypothetical protein